MLNPKNLYRSLRITVLVLFLSNCFTARASLSGTYTINKSAAASSTNYKNIASAVSDLVNGTRSDGGAANGKGVSGAVVFSMADGTYNEQINIITAISGVSATNTITFKSASGDNTKVIISYSGYVFQLIYNSYITFSNLTITNSVDDLFTVSLSNCSHMTFSGCRITGTTKTYYLISDVESGGNDTFINNILTDAATGILSTANTTTVAGHIITGNTINGISKGIAIRDFTSAVISNNNITCDRRADPINFYVQRNNSTLDFYWPSGADVAGISGTVTFTGNNIYVNSYSTSSVGAEFVWDSSSASSPSVIANNMIHANNDVFMNGVTALSIDHSDNLNIAFNNLLATGANTDNYFAAFPQLQNFVIFITNSVGKTLYLYNNNIVSYNAGIDLHMDGKPDLHSDHNNFWSFYPKGHAIGATIDTLVNNYSYYHPLLSIGSWNKATGNDSNSKSVGPGYPSFFDLHSKNPALYHTGIPFAGITKDIDGTTRNSSSPDIGANEFTARNRDAAIYQPERKLPLNCGDTAAGIYYQVINYSKNAIDTFAVGFENLSNHQVYIDTVQLYLQPGELSSPQKFNKATLNTYTGGVQKYRLFTILKGDVDRSNDTVTISQSFTPMLIPFSEYNFERCDKGPLTIIEKGNRNQVFQWNSYNPVTGQESLVSTGDTFKNTVTDTTKFYDIHSFIASYYSVGEKDTTQLKNGFYGNFSQHMTLFLPGPSIIDTVTVYPQKSGSFVIMLDNLYSKKVTVNVSHPGQAVKVPLNWSTVTGKVTLFIDSMTTNLFTTSGTKAYNYISSDSSIAIPSAYSLFEYPYLFDVRLIVKHCENAISTIVHKTVFNAALLKDQGFEGHYYNGTTASPDTICTSNKAIYDLNLSSYFIQSDYGKTWTIDNATATGSHGYQSKNFNINTTQFPVIATFLPQVSEADSLYKLSIRIRRTIGCDTTIERYIYVNKGITASFTAPATACSGDSVKFVDKSSGAGTYYWNFSDNTTSTDQNPVHVFNVSGNDSIQYTVYMAAGGKACGSSDQHNITIYRVPSANFIMKDDGNGKIEFAPSDSMASATYSWNFGDGSTSTSFKPVHTFKKNGTYKVELTTKNKISCGKTYDTTIVIKHVSLDEQPAETNGLKIYPNPARNLVNVSFSLPEQATVSYYLTDENGRRIINRIEGLQKPGNHNIQINLPATLAAGIYFMNLSINDKLTTKQILIAR